MDHTVLHCYTSKAHTHTHIHTDARQIHTHTAADNKTTDRRLHGEMPRVVIFYRWYHSLYELQENHQIPECN